MDKEIVVSGIGIITSIGTGKDDFWKALINGKSGISEVTCFDTSAYPNHKGGEVKDFDAGKYIAKGKTGLFGRASQLAIAASKLAIEDALLKKEAFLPQRAGIILGTTMGESQVLEIMNRAWVKEGVEAVDSRLIGRYPANVLSLNVALELKLTGPNLVIPTACAAGNYAIGYACDLIKNGEADVMLAGGVDAFSRLAFTGFNRLLAVAPEKCQPFDKNRKGMLVGEGAGIVVLETLESALARKASIYARVLGYGLSCDAHHMTQPEANGIAKAITNAMKEANIGNNEVGYISAHGTGTPTNDKVECSALNNVFGSGIKEIPVSSIKSMLGHTMGAASAIEAIACCLTVKHDIIPPTINYETPDPECDIDCVPNFSRKAKVDIALNSASAFGGNNACLVLKKY